MTPGSWQRIEECNWKLEGNIRRTRVEVNGKLFTKSIARCSQHPDVLLLYRILPYSEIEWHCPECQGVSIWSTD